ncbi:MAG: rod shape-determining protein MreD [Spirochaetaceae bacterium]|nr:rod shape-determining protein MreD [Spirochaetaceae bacterium]
MKKVVFFSVLFALMLCLIDTAIISHLHFFMPRPEFVLLLVLYVSLYNGSLVGILTGFFSGLILDFLSLSPLGLHSLIFIVLAFLVGKMHGQYNVNKFLLPILVTIFALAVQTVFLMLLQIVFGTNISVPNIFLPDFWISCCATVICAPLLFLLFQLFPTLLQYREVL